MSTPEVVASVLFWLAVVALVYGYAGFPLLVAVVGWIRNRIVRRSPITPRMSVLIAAYNEERAIAERLENALRSDYPADALEIIVASDGSSDGTQAIVESHGSKRVRLLDLPRRGKIPALDDAARCASGEILVFTDANVRMHPLALRALARNFSDPAVGGVVGNTGYKLEESGESASHGESLYWRYDKWLKEMESRTGSVVSAHGGLYALRRELYQTPGDAAVTDDFIISTAVVEQGCRLVFERDAVAYEDVVPKSAGEFQRRVRLMTRGLRAVAARRRLLNPRRHGFYSVILFSHKVLRRLLPLALLVLFASGAYLAPAAPFYLYATVAQGTFYGLAGAGYLLRRSGVGRLRLFYVPFFYCLANVAALVALSKFLRGERIALWQPQRHAAVATGAATAELGP